MTKAAISRKHRRPKRIPGSQPGNYIIPLRDGRFRHVFKDSNGKWHKNRYDNEQAARLQLNEVAGKNLAGAEVISTNATLDDALDLLLVRNEAEGLEPASRLRVANVVKVH